MAIYKAVTNSVKGRGVGHATPTKLADYLRYKCDESGRTLRDANGQKMRRTDYVTAINAEVDTFSEDCKAVAEDFGVNKTYDDLKYKHYIQGFSPQDSKLMSKDECHQMGVEFAKTFFGDFPVMIATHFEQDTQSGEAHWHNHFLVYNCNVKNGRKLDTANARMREQKRYIVCQAKAHGLVGEELRMVDGVLQESESPNRVSDGEYKVRRYRQKLYDDMKNGATDGDIYKYQMYLTQMQELRIVISEAVLECGNDVEKIRKYLLDVYDVQTKIVRGGELSYLHPDRAKADSTGWVRGRTLGKIYTREAIENYADYEQAYRANFGGAYEQYAQRSDVTESTVDRRSDTETDTLERGEVEQEIRTHDEVSTGRDGENAQGAGKSDAEDKRADGGDGEDESDDLDRDAGSFHL